MDWPTAKYGVIYADPPWGFQCWDGKDKRVASRGSVTPYDTMEIEDICALPVASICADDCCLFLWITWPNLLDAIKLIEAWGFKYKTCAFSWIKAHANQLELFKDDHDTYMGLGYWTRANSEVCLLATRGNPKRINADVRQAIIEPRREHSRKPDCVYDRIERLVQGPYIELFARTRHKGWDAWGNEVGKFNQNQSHALIDRRQMSWDEMWAQPFDWSRTKDFPPA